MQIEPQLKLGLQQITTGLITLLSAFQALLGNSSPLMNTSPDPTADSGENAAPAASKKGGRPKKAAGQPATPASPEPAGQPFDNIRSGVAAYCAVPGASMDKAIVTFDNIRSAVAAYCAVPGASMDKAKAIVLGFGVEKIGQLTDEQRPQVLAAIEKAAVDLKGGTAADDIFTS